MAKEERGGLYGRNFVACASVGLAVQRTNIHDLGLWIHSSAALFGEVKIVFIERVLGVLSAAHHAAAAAIASGALRTFSAEVGVRIGLAGGLAFGRLENADAGAVEGVSNSHRLSAAFEQEIARTENPVLGDTQHA